MTFADRAIVASVRSPEGDFRDWEEIAEWGRGHRRGASLIGASDATVAPRKFHALTTSTQGMTKKYEIRSGRRTVSVRYSVSPLQAVVDYVSTFGCSRDEIVTLGVDAVAWRGARFTAVLAPPEPSRSEH
jgi:hypothetical protein